MIMGYGAKKNVWYRSLVFKVAVCASGMLALTTIVMAAVAFKVGREFVRDEIHQRLRIAAIDHQKMITAFVRQQHERAGLVASCTRLRSLVEKYLADELSREAMRDATRPILADAQQSSDGFLDIWICDSKGKVITATDDKYIGQDFSNSPAFRLGSRQQHLDRPQLTDGKSLAYLSAPARARDGRLLGVVMILLDATRLVEIISDRTGMGETGEVLVAIREGDHIRHFAPQRNDGSIRNKVSQVTAMRNAINGATSLSGVRTNYNGRDVLAVYKPIEIEEGGSNKWGLVAKIDTAEAYQPLQQLGLWLGTTGMVFLVLGASATAWGAITTFRPLRTLTKAALAVSSGQLDTRAPVASDDECGVLARTFNGMVDHLAGVNERLESQVEERTAKLKAILDSAANGIVMIDERGVIDSVNPAVKRIFGYTSDELLGKNVSMLMPSPQREEHDQYIARYLQTGGKKIIGIGMEVEGIRKDGTTFPLELSVEEVELDGRRFFAGCICDISERKEAVKALRESEAKFQQLAAHLQDTLWMTNGDGSEIIYVSPAYESIWGRSCESLYENPSDWIDGLHPEDRERVTHSFYEDAPTGDYNETFRVIRPDGSLRWIHAIGYPIRNDMQQVYRIAGVARDVTERIKFEAVLRTVNERLRETTALQRAILNSVKYTVITVDSEGRITSFNKVAEKMFGYRAKEVVGKTTPVILHDKQEVVEYARVLLQELGQPVKPGIETFLTKPRMGEVEERKWTGIRKDGSRFPMLLSITRIVNDHGEITGFLGMAQDITEREKVEAELRESERFARCVLDSLLCFAGVSDTDGILLEVNQAALTVTGLRSEDLIGTPLEELYSFSYESTVQRRIREAIEKAARGEISRFDVSGPVAGGKLITVDFQIVPLRNDEGKITHLVPSAIDVTDRIRYEQRLEKAKEESEQASLAKSQFLAAMSHELRTPLHGVIGMTELLMNTELDGPQRQFVKACHGSGTALLTLINDILDFSKIEAGKLELESASFELHDLLEDLVGTLAFQASEKGLELFARVSSDVPDCVIGDAGKLRQILVNLIGNALKFTDQGEINVRVTKVGGIDDDLLRFEVADTGVGVPPELVDSLFDSFTQADSSTSRKYGGTGLGLAICKHLVEMMEGQIGVESDVNSGSMFWFEIPLKRVAALQESDCASRLLDQRKVLLFATPAVARFLADTFTDWQMQVDVASSTDEVFHKLRTAVGRSRPLDLVVVEEQALSGNDLSSFLQTKKSDPDTGPTKLLLVTSQCSRLSLAERRDIDNVVQRPLSQSALLNAINECVFGNTQVQSSDEEHEELADGLLIPAVRVLLAEDNTTNQLYTRELLKQRGIQCDCVISGKEALVAVKSRQYGLVLMDCHMPEMDGFEATRTIRQMERQGELEGHLPIIALTANAIKGDRERCVEAGMDDYLSKPFEPQQFLRLITDLLSNSSASCGMQGADQRQSLQAAEPADLLPVNLEDLLARCMCKLDFAQELLLDFEAVLPSRVQEVSGRIAAGDAEGMGEVAHSLKGAAGIVGAEGVHRVAAALETCGKSGRLADVATLLNELNGEVKRFLEAVPEIRSEFESSLPT